MKIGERIRWGLTGILGRIILWVWCKLARIEVKGEEEYRILRSKRIPVIILVWHGRIFLVPYFFRHRGSAPLISPSRDGEIVSSIMSRWGYKIIRGSSSHSIIKPWNEMKKELQRGGEVIIVPDGPRGPNRKMKIGCLKLAQETGAYLIPFTFAASRKRFFKSWDQFMIFLPFSRVLAVYGPPILVSPELGEQELEREREKIERIFVDWEREIDGQFN